MLKKLLICVLLLLFAVPSLANGLPSEPKKGIGMLYQDMPTADDLIYRAYNGLILWTLKGGQYTKNKDGSRMRYRKFMEVMQAPTQPATVTGIPFGPPKMLKVYFQVVARAKTAVPKSVEDIDAKVRIIVVETTRGEKLYTSKYYVGIDNNLDGLPNSVEEWTAYKSLETKRIVKRDKEKAPDVPKLAEIVDPTWDMWLAEFIKLYQLHALEDLSAWYKEGPGVQEAIFEELAYEDKRSDSRSNFNFNPASDADIWPNSAYAEARPAGL
jgi:hypothetical protein